jgi:hypothetical protein
LKPVLTGCMALPGELPGMQGHLKSPGTCPRRFCPPELTMAHPVIPLLPRRVLYIIQ